MKNTFCILLFIHVALTTVVTGQELYVFSDPASNVPAKSISAKYSLKLANMRMHDTRTAQRHNPELMFGLNKNWMLRAGATVSDMFTDQVRLESGKLYAKYRFLSNDQVHKHFRMAAFAQYSQSRNELMFDELSLDGDQSGVQAGIIATQLWNKLAVSTTVSALQVTTPRHKYFPDYYSYQAFNYSLSAGLLVLPVEYTSYKQTNLNLYVELLGQQSLDKQKYYVDLAPAVQLIFNSTYKLNMGYRFQLKSNMIRMSENSFHVSVEAVFLDALKRKRRG
jgi:hypothetical protein